MRRSFSVLASSAPTTLGPVMTGVLSFLPTAFCTGLVLSPVLTCRQIEKDGTIGRLSPAPVVACANTCVVFTTFGALLNDGQGDWVVMTPNIIGTIFSAYYLRTFHKFSERGTMTKWFVGSAGLCGASSAIALGAIPTTDPSLKVTVLGYAASSLALWLALSPLSGLPEVIRTKTTSSLPFPICLASTMNAASWVAYGLLVADNPFLYYPNTIGFSAGLLQLSCFAAYGFPDAKDSSGAN